MVVDFSTPSMDLSAPALVTMLWGPEITDTWAIKLALFELVVRRDIELTWKAKHRWLRSTDPIVIVDSGKAAPGYRPPSLQIVLDTWANHQAVSPVQFRTLIQDVLKQQLARKGKLRRRWMPSGPTFIEKCVMAELATKGVVEPPGSGQHWTLGPRMNLTENGQALLAQLRSLIDFARGGYENLATTDPPAAIRFANTHGSMLMLVRSLVPTYRALVKWQQRNGFGEDPPRARDGSGFSSDYWPVGLHLLAGTFGPGGRHDVDTMFHLIAGEVDIAWSTLQGSIVLGSYGE